MKLDVRFKNKQYNASPYVQEKLLLEAIIESKHQQNIAENDSETQMPEESQSQIEVTQGQTLTQLSRNSIIVPRPCTSKDSDTQKFCDEIFADQDAVPGFTIVDRSLEDIINDEINNYLKKPVPLNHAESISFDVLQWWKEHKK